MVKCAVSSGYIYILVYSGFVAFVHGKNGGQLNSTKTPRKKREEWLNTLLRPLGKGA